VRVLASGDAAVLEAPLASPPEEIDARVFAAIAGDVVLRALGAAGHAAAAGPVAPGPEAAGSSTPLPPLEHEAAAPARKKPRVRRFFLRAGGALGFGLIREGMTTDRQPPKMFIQDAIQVQTATNSVETVGKRGSALSPAFELVAGAHLTERFALASFLRLTPTAGKGNFNHALFGVQAEYAVFGRRDGGFWTSLGAGLGVGRIQVKPPSKITGGPYATSGLGAAHLTLPFGYRFLPSFGLYAALSARVLFPDVLWVVDPALGVEGRL
jgi:hypothetical protein